MSARDKIMFTLAEGTLTLYPTDGAGNPVLTAPVWSGACLERLRLRETWLQSETRPTGRKYPRRRSLVPQYSIDIDRLWVTRNSPTGDFATSHQGYVLDLLFEDELTGDWLRKTFYGVSIAERETAAQAAAAEFIDGQSFLAEYFTESSGLGSPPVISSTVPLTVWWVGDDGTRPLYTHDPLSYAFTESSAGVTTGRATVLYSPNQSGTFEITFAGPTTLALSVVGEIVNAGDFIQGAPNLADVPRLDFMVGAQRVASVTKTKKFFAADFIQQDEPSDSSSQFLIRAASDLVLKIGRTAVTADDFAQTL